ncbi:hypothetical protein [Polaribacter aquimarinus]|uniref:DUF4142 domain-containing protein n=1 Tax=Polaribacter aquimarinus TaxID=2100726 RepID=A0A2U2JC24_9FLAO|nr:hypothetical protein [Polaribacter aquimarinus]PWG05888.1 hypothetical protein DIS07_05450 [Polaribacter aquimarinus]
MKNLFILFILVFTIVSQAQMRNNGVRQNGLPQVHDAPPKPNFQVEKQVGIVIYDVKKAVKKSGVKLSSKTGKTFSKTLESYNKSINDIKRINSFLLKSTKVMVESFQKKAIKTGDFSEQPRVYKKVQENLKPITETLKAEDKKLDKKVKNLLSKKQYKKWIKFNKKLNKIFPKE